MRDFLKTSYFRKIALAVLFIVGAWFTYKGTYNLYPIVTYYGRGLATVLPVSLPDGLFLFSFIMLSIIWGVGNVRSKWRAVHVYTVTTMLISVISFLLNVLYIFAIDGYFSMVLTSFFPWDILIVQIAFMVISILCLVWLIKNRGYRYVEPTIEGPKKRIYVRCSIYACFASYFLGLFYSRYDLITIGYIDPNFYGILPIIFIFLLPNIEFFFYGFSYLVSPDKFLRVYKKSMIIMAYLIVISYGWLAIALGFNIHLIAESACNFFPIGFAAKIPIGLFVIFLVVAIPLVFSAINYKKVKAKYEQKQESNTESI